MPNFVHRTRIEAPAAVVFAWHERPGALERLTPPWETVEVVERTGGIRDGDRVTIRSRVGPTWTKWVVEHRDYVEGVQFRDIQISGPFKRWEHTHRVIPDGERACILEDDITFDLPLGLAGRILGGHFVESKLKRLFQYRHSVTRDDVLAQVAVPERKPLRVLVSGSNGLVGEHLVSLLTTCGHDVVRLTRQAGATDNNHTAAWDPNSGKISLDASLSIDAVVHLAGETIAGRWSADSKQRIRDSRINGTRQLVDWMATLETRPSVFVCASAIGFYGSRGDEVLNEQSAKGTGFLADVCESWESEAARAASDETRSVQLRFGVILSPRGGALAKMLTPFRLGGGGIIGDGNQFWSWVSVDDATGAILHALDHPEIEGPVNVVSPEPASNRDFTKRLGSALQRPTILPMPRPAARMAFGEMADELLLASQRVEPQKLQQTGYRFRHSQLGAAFRHLLGLSG